MPANEFRHAQIRVDAGAWLGALTQKDYQKWYDLVFNAALDFILVG